MSEIIWFCSIHKSSGYIPHYAVHPFCGNLWRKVRGKRFGNLHWRAWKNAGFCHVRSPGNLSVESEAWWSLSFTTFCFPQKNLPEVQDFSFFSWCLATERGWGWQNEDAAGSWGEQKEGKDRRLADDAGESGSKVLPWENRPRSGAECTFPAPVCCCQQWQGIFWREFHVLTLSLGVSAHFQTCWCWSPCTVTICCCCGRDLCDGSLHPSFPQEPFQF